MSIPTVHVHRRGAAAIVELHRPDSMNAWDGQLGAELLVAVEQAAGDDDVRAVCLTGAGRAFSSGADLHDLGAAEHARPDGRPDLQRMLGERYHPIISLVRTMPKPVVAAVNGPAAGIGLSLALAADLVVARRSAFFLLAFVNIGLVPDGGASLLVPARVGFTRAAEMAMLGERIDAEQAAAWGLINRVWPDEDFDAEVDALVDRLAAGPTRAYAGVKRQLNASVYGRLDDQLALEAAVQGDLAGSDDFVEGVLAFTQKRPSAFRGR